MHVDSHTIVNDYFQVGNNTLLPAFWSVDDTSIVRAHAHDTPVPSISHDRECTVAGVCPKELLSILPGAAYRYIKPLHWSLTTRIQPLLLGAHGRWPMALNKGQDRPDFRIAQHVLEALHGALIA